MKFIFVFIFVLVSSVVYSQNVGQEGDSLVNYVDINGFKQGDWEVKYQTGKIKYKGYFIDDEPVGEFKRYDEVGRLYAELFYHKEVKKVNAIFYHISGKIASKGNYIDKLKDSTWMFYNKKGKLLNEENYHLGKKQGVFKQFTFEGVLLEEVNYSDDLKHGSWKKFYTGSEIKFEANFVLGIQEGDTKTYYPSGKVYMEGKYVNDLKEGAWFKYAENGSLLKIYQYINGSSPEAMEEEDELFKEVDENKDTYDEPRANDDIDWLRGSKR